MPNYRPAPVCFKRGEGVYLEDVSGRRYLDWVSGIAVSALGHGHEGLVARIREQVESVLHVSNLYLNGPSIELAERLTKHSFGDRVFFCNSGAEANEAALKLARRFAHAQGEGDRVEVVTFEGAFHGRTYGALAATGRYQEGFGPMLPGFRQVPFGDEAAAAAVINENTAAVLVEPIQGEGGVNPAPAGFLQALRRLCDDAGALLVVDEVQAGVGRTGTLFAHEADGVRPDIMSLAKGLGGGLPLGAVVAREAVAAALVPGTHGSTFGGNPVAAAAACVVLDTVTEPEFLAGIQRVGQCLRDALAADRFAPHVERVRGRGLMLGAVLAPPIKDRAADIVTACRDRGLLIHTAGPGVLRILPPLILSEDDVATGCDILSSAIEATSGSR